MKTDLRYWQEKAQRIIGDSFIESRWAPKGIWLSVRGANAARILNERLLGKASRNVAHALDKHFIPTDKFSIFIETGTWNNGQKITRPKLPA